MSNGVIISIRMWSSKPDKSMEEVILNAPWKYYGSQKAYQYARNILKKRWKRGEEVILKTPYYSYLYARHVINMPSMFSKDDFTKQKIKKFSRAAETFICMLSMFSKTDGKKWKTLCSNRIASIIITLQAILLVIASTLSKDDGKKRNLKSSRVIRLRTMQNFSKDLTLKNLKIWSKK